MFLGKHSLATLTLGYSALLIVTILVPFFQYSLILFLFNPKSLPSICEQLLPMCSPLWQYYLSSTLALTTFWSSRCTLSQRSFFPFWFHLHPTLPGIHNHSDPDFFIISLLDYATSSFSIFFPFFIAIVAHFCSPNFILTYCVNIFIVSINDSFLFFPYSFKSSMYNK